LYVYSNYIFIHKGMENKIGKGWTFYVHIK
jgi:hypothetical protein